MAAAPVHVAVIACGAAVIVGTVLTVTTVDAVDRHPVGGVQFTEYVVDKAGVTTIEAVDSPVDQAMVPPWQPPTVSVADCPEQTVAELTVRASGSATVMVVLATSEHPSTLVTVTEYTPLSTTSIDGVDWPVDQAYVAPPPAVRVALVPSQIVALLTETVATGTGLTVAVPVAVAEHPALVIPVTEYVPLAVAVATLVVPI